MARKKSVNQFMAIIGYGVPIALLLIGAYFFFGGSSGYGDAAIELITLVMVLAALLFLLAQQIRGRTGKR